MGEVRPRFGTQRSADVKLFLTGPDDNKYKKNPVHLHTQILKRLKGFEGKFSNRWEPYKSTEIRVTTSHSFDHYLKCIEIMYGEHVDFPNIEECLAILTIASSEMSADECINKCMEYLEAVRWSAEEESQIRKVLASDGLKLKISADLAARLHQEDGDNRHDNFVEKIIQEMVSLVKSTCSTLSRNRETAEKDLRGILEGNTSRDVVDVCGRVLLQEFKASVDSRNLSTLKLIFNLIQHCKGAILEAALKLFCEDAEFINCVKKRYCSSNLFISSSSIDEPVFDILVWFMKATGEGKIIIPRASRMSLLTTWLPIVGKVRFNGSLTKSEQRDKAMLSVVESLPQVDQKRICVIWAEVYRLNQIDIATPFTLSKSLLA